MSDLLPMIHPDRKKFAADPFGYSALAWYKLGTAHTLAGFPVNPEIRPTSADLKTPILWMTQARALSEAAHAVLTKEPSWENLPVLSRGICDSQFCATGVMLVGYSLEVCLKAMLIMRMGVEAYTSDEKNFLHHRLEDLSEFIPDLSAKDKAILRVLTHFTMWAGRYPDPGSRYESNTEEIFALSEQHRIDAHDLFEVAARVMRYAQVVAGGLSAPAQKR